MSGEKCPTCARLNLDPLVRPQQAVDLPTEPTLGWAANSAVCVLGTWNQEPKGRWLTQREGTLMYAVSFTPAVAVPQSALDALRRALEFGPYGAQEGATKFLAAVDAANGDAS